MASDQPELKPLQNSFPPLHLLSAINSSVTSSVVAGTSSVPVSLIPVFQPSMFGSGLIGLPLTLNHQALFQANMDAAANNAKTLEKTATTAASENQNSSNKSIPTSSSGKSAVKRKYTEALIENTTGKTPAEIAVDLARVQPKTSKGKVYSWMWSANPKRQRARITEAMKKEIIEFCKNHTMLKQGEIADIFGVDRTTVTKMLKRSQEAQEDDEAIYDLGRRYRDPQYELEDMLYRWISNSTKHHPINQPVWSCDQLLEQAQELQNLTETGNEVYPDMEWLLDFLGRFRLKRIVTDCK